MVWTLATKWMPTRLLEVAHSVDTSTGATEVETDAGRAYIKTLGNRQGPHVLATDWVGTHLARWFGLSTFDIAILPVDDFQTFNLPRGGKVQPGPAFAAKAMAGEPWDRSDAQLDSLVNPQDIARLVVFDTWTLNCDRHYHDPSVRKPNYDNVFLASEGLEPGRRRLIAMDHGLCFIHSGEDLTSKLANIDKIRDEHVYGMFPGFHKKLHAFDIVECVHRLSEMDVSTASAIIDTVPKEWEVSPLARAAWVELISQRAIYLADTITERLWDNAPQIDLLGE